jgi:hypothetical protein
MQGVYPAANASIFSTFRGSMPNPDANGLDRPIAAWRLAQFSIKKGGDPAGTYAHNQCRVYSR